MNDPHYGPGYFSSREMLSQTACGFGHLALLGLLGETARAGAATALTDRFGGEKNLLTPKSPHFAPRAKRVIFLLMHGGIS